MVVHGVFGKRQVICVGAGLCDAGGWSRARLGMALRIILRTLGSSGELPN